MENNIRHEGVVQSIDGLNVMVKMTVGSACAGCHAKGVCGAAESRDKVVNAVNINNLDLSVGDTVAVEMRQGLAMKAVVICYLVPFVVLFASFCLMYLVCKVEWVNVAVSLGLTALYFVLLWFFRKRIEKNVTFVVTKPFQS
jgi:sigma-E factor negative regulatory protein RseC